MNTIIHVDGGKYACSDVGIKAAIAALPQTGSTPGGHVKVDGCPVTSDVILNSTITVGSTSVPVWLEYGPGTFRCAMTSGAHCNQVNGQGSKVTAANPLLTDFTCTNGFTGDFFHVEPLSGVNSLIDIKIGDFRIDQSSPSGNCTNSLALNLLSVRDPSYFYSIDIRNWTGTTINVGISGNGSGILSQGLHFQDIYAQSSTGALTADSFILQGNQSYVGPNFRLISSSATPGTFNGIKILATVAGDGRGNAVSNCSVAGYTGGAGVFVTSTNTAPTSGAFANYIGVGCTFEQDLFGVILTGADASHKASRNFIVGNSYIPSTSNLVKMDFATGNYTGEVTNGNACDITYTGNAKGNRFVGILIGGSTGDICDSGVNPIDDGYASGGGFSERDIWGEVNFLRGNTGAIQWKFNDNGTITGASGSGVSAGTGGISTTGQLTSSIATGTPPLVVSSTTNVPNLNASTLNGATFASPGAIGGTTPSSGAFTTVSASGQITSTLSTGTAPFSIASTTVVPNLNVSQLLGNTWAVPGTIGSTTPNSGAFTTVSANATAPSAAGTAGFGYDSTTKSPNYNSNAGTTSSFSGAWNAVNITPVTLPGTSTTNDQNLMTVTIPAGVLNKVNKGLRIYAAGVYSTAATSTAQITGKAKICTVSGCGSGTVLAVCNIQTIALASVTVTNNTWVLECTSFTQTAGASAAFERSGKYAIDLGSLTTAADSVFLDPNATATLGTIDSTAQLFLQITIAFSSASASNVATERQLLAETVN